MMLEKHSNEGLLSELADMRQRLAMLQSLVDEHEHTRIALAEKTCLSALREDVGTALAGSDSLRVSMQRCAEAMVQHLGVVTASIWTCPSEEKTLELQASAGLWSPLRAPDVFIPTGVPALARIVRERRPYLTNTVLDDPHMHDRAWAQRTETIAFAGYPCMAENRLVGVMAMFARKPFTPSMLQGLAWMADVIAMGIDRIYIADALARSIAKTVRMNKTLHRTYAEFDEFTYIASHDLKEPLRKLHTFSTLLRKDLGKALPERAQKDLDFITDAATRMHVLIQNLLELSRVGSTTMKREEIDLDSCVDRALQALTVPVQATQAAIVRHTLPTVWGDRALLTQLYQHLLSNALKFCNAPQPVIQLTAAYQEGQLVLGMKDNGIGVKPEYHQQIFAPFKRLHGRGEYEGVGIGLAICRKTVERHGGRIWIDSDCGRGAHVQFTLADGETGQACAAPWMLAP